MTEQIQNLPTVEPVQLTAKISAPVVIEANFEAFKNYVAGELQRYDVVVTADTLADCKKLATELNKQAADIKARGKVITDEAAEPITAVKNQIAAIVQMCLDGREKLTQQIKTFEDETRKLCDQLLNAARSELWASTGVLEEFQRAQYADLVILTNVTGKGALTTKAKQEVQTRVNADKQLQDQTNMRLLMLENTCLKAGMISSLTRAHVETFLFADDATYQARLDSLIASELERQRATEQRLREQQAAEQRRIDEQRQREAEAAQQRALDEQAARLKAEHAAAQPAPVVVTPQPTTQQVDTYKAAPQPAPQPQPIPAPAQPVAAPSIIFGFGDKATGKVSGKHTDISEAGRLAFEFHQQNKVDTAIWQRNESGVLLVAIVTDGAIFWRAQ